MNIVALRPAPICLHAADEHESARARRVVTCSKQGRARTEHVAQLLEVVHRLAIGLGGVLHWAA